MLPFILSILVLVTVLYGIGKVVNDRKKHDGRDYTDYFQENEKKDEPFLNELLTPVAGCSDKHLAHSLLRRAAMQVTARQFFKNHILRYCIIVIAFVKF